MTPASREVRARGEITFTGEATDASGTRHRRTSRGASRRPRSATFVRGRGGVVTFRAGRAARQRNRHGDGERRDSLVGSASVVVRAADAAHRGGDLPQHVSRRRGHARGGRRSAQARLPARRSPSSSRLDDRRVARARAVTGAAGKARTPPPPGRGCFTVVVARAERAGIHLGRPHAAQPLLPPLRRRRRAGRRATPSASRARSRGAGSRSCPRRSA